jgi:ATP-dependent DNA ligase
MAFDRLPIRPPVAPMLARLARELPRGEYLYEPKWDGFRALVFRDGEEVEIQSRHGRPLARYFPELIDAIASLAPDRLVLDGEILVVRGNRHDFETLMLRTHPARSRVATLSREAPATFVAFDLLAEGSHLLIDAPFVDRRARMLAAVGDAGEAPIRATPATRDPGAAGRWLRWPAGGGIDGVVVKDLAGVYEPGRRALVKVKVERTADCVVAGMRAAGRGAVASLLLGLYDDDGRLRHVGVCASFPVVDRRRLYELLVPRVMPLDEHPWAGGFGLESSPLGRFKGSAGRWAPGMSPDWLPIRPIVAEVAYDIVDRGARFRHPARFRRWRPDRVPESCDLHQLDAPA